MSDTWKYILFTQIKFKHFYYAVYKKFARSLPIFQFQASLHCTNDQPQSQNLVSISSLPLKFLIRSVHKASNFKYEFTTLTPSCRWPMMQNTSHNIDGKRRNYTEGWFEDRCSQIEGAPAIAEPNKSSVTIYRNCDACIFLRINKDNSKFSHNNSINKGILGVLLIIIWIYHKEI